MDKLLRFNLLNTRSQRVQLGFLENAIDWLVVLTKIIFQVPRHMYWLWMDLRHYGTLTRVKNMMCRTLTVLWRASGVSSTTKMYVCNKDFLLIFFVFITSLLDKVFQSGEKGWRSQTFRSFCCSSMNLISTVELKQETVSLTTFGTCQPRSVVKASQ